MENKKLLKFLLKDIAEVEELFAEKGSSGFDDYEMEFLRNRFEGAKQIIHILNEKDVDRANDPGIVEMPVVKTEDLIPSPDPVENIKTEETEFVPKKEENQEEAEVGDMAEIQEEETQEITVAETTEPVNETAVYDAEPAPDEEEVMEEVSVEPQRLSDRFVKEKSLNDTLANGSSKLETKLSNSPVSSLHRAIGINDRYIYIRELFDGSADTFSKTVTELDNLQNIEEAVAYLQQNYKWKKNDASLKFVNLVKRRFPNG